MTRIFTAMDQRFQKLFDDPGVSNPVSHDQIAAAEDVPGSSWWLWSTAAPTRAETWRARQQRREQTRKAMYVPMERSPSNHHPLRTRSTTALGAVALVLTLPLAVTGCVQGPPSTPGDEPLTLNVIDDGNGKHAVVVDEAKSNNTVESPETKTAVLEIGQGSCYYLTRKGGPPSTLLIFPAGTTLEAGDPNTVVVGGKAYPAGTLISVTGEAVQLSAANNDQAMPCLAAAGAFFVTSASGIQESQPSTSSSS